MNCWVYPGRKACAGGMCSNCHLNNCERNCQLRKKPGEKEPPQLTLSQDGGFQPNRWWTLRVAVCVCALAQCNLLTDFPPKSYGKIHGCADPDQRNPKVSTPKMAP